MVPRGSVIDRFYCTNICLDRAEVEEQYYCIGNTQIGVRKSELTKCFIFFNVNAHCTSTIVDANSYDQTHTELNAHNKHLGLLNIVVVLPKQMNFLNSICVMCYMISNVPLVHRFVHRTGQASIYSIWSVFAFFSSLFCLLIFIIMFDKK